MGVLGNNIRLGSSAAGAYEIKKSLRFNGEQQDTYLKRTGTAGNRRTWTISCWIKLSNTDRRMIAGAYHNGNQVMSIDKESGGVISFYDYTSGYNYRLRTNREFEDESSWYHFIFSIDTTQGTSSNRVKMWVNGVKETSFQNETYPSQNYEGYWNGTWQQSIGTEGSNIRLVFSGYIAEWHFIDGQQLEPSAFAETNEDTGQWVPKKYEGTYGSQGYYLNFEDNSGTTATTLGKDSSGNGNNWTPMAFSVAAGWDHDVLEDTPTNNFPTFNHTQSAGGQVANGNLDVNYTDSNDNASNTATMGMRTGKWYYEITDRTDSSGIGAAIQGVCPDSYMETKRMENGWPGYGTGSGIGFNGSDQHYTTGSNLGTYGGTWTTNDVIGVAVDADAGKIALSKNGQWADGAGNFDEAGITGGAQKTIPGDAPYFAVVSDTSGSHDPKYSVNWGQLPFIHTPPAGYKKLCSKNLPEPPSLKSSDYFNTKLYTGNNSTQVISGVGFQSDIAWFKPRSIGDNNVFWRRDGSTHNDWKYQYTNTNGGENVRTDGSGITAWGSDGYTIGNWNNLNTNSATMAIWSWKESATAGLDIVKYTGNGSNRAIDHNLNAVPEMMWIKRTDGAGSWMVYHKAMGNTHYLEVNGGNAYSSKATVWNNTSPTSTQFTVGTDGDVNGNGQSHVAYLFSSIEGYSKVGSFTGNGSSNGPYVYTGFRPQFLLVRAATQGNNWAIIDDKRDPYNSMHERLHPNTTGGTNAGAGNVIDFYSNGFKCVNTDSLENPSGHTAIYLAIAERPFKYSNAF